MCVSVGYRDNDDDDDDGDEEFERGGGENVRKTEMERGKRVAGKDIEPNRTPCFERHKRGT